MIFQCGLNMVHTQWIFIGFEAILKKNSELWREKPYFFRRVTELFIRNFVVWFGGGGGGDVLSNTDR